MRRERTMMIALACALAALPGIANSKQGKLEKWQTLVRRVEIRSTKDSSLQPAWVWTPPKAATERVPLFVGLHTWSMDMTNTVHYWGAYRWCKAQGWALVCPNFRGSNNKPAACGSALAVQDIVDAVNWMKANCKIDDDRVYIMGGSGGGHMALMMAGYAPEIFAGVVAWCAMPDLALWHAQVQANGNAHYARMLERSCGGTPAERPNEYLLRSPRTWLCRARDKGVPVYLGTGVHDGHRGSVPAGQSAYAFNELCDAADRLTDDDIAYLNTHETVKPEQAYRGPADPFYPQQLRIHFRRTSRNAQLTYFEGGHACNFPAGFEWLARQRRGQKADFATPKAGTGEAEKLSR